MYNNQITFTNTRDKKIIVNHVAKYKEIASEGSRKYKKVRGVGGITEIQKSSGGEGALADQEMRPFNYVCRKLFQVLPETAKNKKIL